jgi:ribosomal protein S18 acetylase RimI-like enzyme
MQNPNFRLRQLDDTLEPDEAGYLADQLVELMSRMYDFHASLHPDWRTRSNWQRGSKQWLTRVSEDWFRALIFPEGDEKACGYVLASFHYEAPLFVQNRFGYIADLWVDTEYRGQSAAELLLAAAYGWFRQQGVKRVQLEVDVHNDRAVHFWHKQGFKDFQTVMRRDID